jgi:hypothetical protein
MQVRLKKDCKLPSGYECFFGGILKAGTIFTLDSEYAFDNVCHKLEDKKSKTTLYIIKNTNSKWEFSIHGERRNKEHSGFGYNVENGTFEIITQNIKIQEKPKQQDLF